MSNNKWIIRSDDNHDCTRKKVSLFCFPFAGGGASVYRLWNRSLPYEVDVCAVQYPGHEGRIAEQLFDDIRQLVAHFIQESEELFRDAPFILFGHSLGAKICCEVTKQLAEKGLFPEAIIVSGSRPPWSAGIRCLHSLPPQEFIDELRTMEGTPEAILQSVEFMDLFLPILRADFAMDEEYVLADFQVSCPVLVCYGQDDKELQGCSMTAWGQCAQDAFQVEKFPGGHFYLKSEQQKLLQCLNQFIQQTVMCHV